MIKVAILACVALLTACASQPSASTANPPAVAATSRSVREYSVIMGGAVAGTEVVNVEGETRLIACEYNEWGRGPKTNATLNSIATSSLDLNESNREPDAGAVSPLPATPAAPLHLLCGSPLDLQVRCAALLFDEERREAG